jgi:copper chaperone CopZ
MTTSTYTVTGMTCGHCVAAVSAEVGAVPGVSAADVDLESGTLTVTSAGPVERASIAAAVAEAGYSLSGTPSRS